MSENLLSQPQCLSGDTDLDGRSLDGPYIHQSPWCSGLQTRAAELTGITVLTGSPACEGKSQNFTSVCNWMSQFLTFILSLCTHNIYISTPSPATLENPSTASNSVLQRLEEIVLVGGGREAQQGVDCVYIRCIHVDVWQRPTQYRNYPSVKKKEKKKKLYL